MSSDLIKRGVAEVAFDGFREGKSIVHDGTIGYSIWSETPLNMYIKVWDPSRRANRLFVVNVKEDMTIAKYNKRFNEG